MPLVTKEGRPLFEPLADEWRAAKSVPLANLMSESGDNDTCPFCGSDGFELADRANLWRCSNCANDRWHSGVGFLMRQYGIEALDAAWLLVRMAGES